MEELLKSLSTSCSELSSAKIELQERLADNKDDKDTAQMLIKIERFTSDMLLFEKDLMKYLTAYPDNEPVLDVSGK